MGQNFLVDRNITTAIIRLAGFESSDTVIEIGPGLGALTIPLSKWVKAVYAIETDRKIVSILTRQLIRRKIFNVSVIENDILKFDLNLLSRREGEAVKVAGNLPYHISSQILVRLMEYRHFISSAVLMFQKELADRLLASPGSKTYGRLSVLLQYAAHAKRLLRVPASAFYPRPKIESEVLKITYYNPLPVRAEDEQHLFRVVGAAFGKRRKTLQNALLKSNLECTKEAIIRAFKSANIDPSRRAETLDVEEFIRLANHLKK